MTGLGARGLIYHGWLGEQLAAAVAADDEQLLAPQLRRWRRQATALCTSDATEDTWNSQWQQGDAAGC